MSLKITVPGNPFETTIVDSTGRNLCNDLGVEQIDVSVSVAGASATVRLLAPHFEAECGAVRWETKNPLTGAMEQIRAIELTDGTRVELSRDGAWRVMP